jgi:membrane fusion protein (multidrug efflux system)
MQDNNEANGGSPAAGRPESRPPAARRRPFLILGGVAALVLGGLGVHALLTAHQESTDDAQVEADVVSIAPRVGGQVLHVLVKDNQVVRKGDVLVEIDDSDYAARVRQATAEL